MSKETCNKGHKGDCCCNCKNQIKLFCHPWNQNIGKGAISEPLGFGCTAFGEENVIFYEEKHGICELYLKKEGSEDINI